MLSFFFPHRLTDHFLRITPHISHCQQAEPVWSRKNSGHTSHCREAEPASSWKDFERVLMNRFHYQQLHVYQRRDKGMELFCFYLPTMRLEAPGKGTWYWNNYRTKGLALCCPLSSKETITPLCGYLNPFNISIRVLNDDPCRLNERACFTEYIPYQIWRWPWKMWELIMILNCAYFWNYLTIWFSIFFQLLE